MLSHPQTATDPIIGGTAYCYIGSIEYHCTCLAQGKSMKMLITSWWTIVLDGSLIVDTMMQSDVIAA